MDGVRNISITTILDSDVDDVEFKVASKMEGYVSKKVNRTLKREEMRDKTKGIKHRKR